MHLHNNMDSSNIWIIWNYIYAITFDDIKAVMPSAFSSVLQFKDMQFSTRRKTDSMPVCSQPAHEY